MLHMTIKRLLRAEQAKNAQLAAELEKKNADIEYIAMMTDVELDEEDVDNEQQIQ